MSDPNPMETRDRDPGPATLSPIEGDRLVGVSPIDLAPLDPVPITERTAVVESVERARAALDEWSRLPLTDRARFLETAARAMLLDRHRAVELVRLEMGKLEVDAMFTEGLGPLDTVKGWVRIIQRAGGRERVRLNPIAFPGKKAFIDLVPRGVVGVIAPWNFPIAGLYRSVFPALLTGNAVIVKPSEHSPRSSAWFIEKLAAELPPGVVQVVQGGGDTGQALVESGVDAVVFTGSTAVGKAVAVRCAELGIPCSPETGGNDAAIVLEDADLDRTSAGLTQWALQNAGQSCGAVEIAYVEERIADDLAKRLAHAFSRLRVGPGREAEVDISPVAHARQLALIEAHVADALSKGAELLCGGRRTGDGLWYEPTLLDRCTDAMEVVQEETFGPVLALARVEGPTEAIRRINRGRYGLTCSLWTRDIQRAERLARRIDVGVVTINNHSMTGAIPELPWSGTRGSGLGIANSRHALATFCRPKALLVDESKSPEPFWLPYDRNAFLLADILAESQLFRLDRVWRLPLLLRERVRAVKAFFQEAPPSTGG